MHHKIIKVFISLMTKNFHEGESLFKAYISSQCLAESKRLLHVWKESATDSYSQEVELSPHPYKRFNIIFEYILFSQISSSLYRYFYEHCGSIGPAVYLSNLILLIMNFRIFGSNYQTLNYAFFRSSATFFLMLENSPLHRDFEYTPATLLNQHKIVNLITMHKTGKIIVSCMLRF